MQFIKSRVPKWHLHNLVRFKSLHYNTFLIDKFLSFFAAYGEYNNMTMEVAHGHYQMGFQVSHCFLFHHFNLFLFLMQVFFLHASVAQETQTVFHQTSRKQSTMKWRPVTILSLQYKVPSMFTYFFLSPSYQHELFC